MKKASILIAAFVVLQVLLYAGITMVNDSIAAKLERTLLEATLPPETELLDSMAVAARLEGNGNGMQYFGAILLSSDLSQEELYAHYESFAADSDWFDVEWQETQQISGLNADLWFDVWETPRAANYRVELWKHSTVGFEESVGEAILNFDLRGH